MTTMQQTPGQLVGQRVKRREDPRLIKGRATYVDDIKLVGMLHMAVRRSDVAHGNIRDIDTSAAEAMDGVVAVFTGAQLKDEMSPMPIGTPFPAPDHYPVAHDKVRFVGEPIAVVVATDRYKARDGADAIVVDIEELPAVVDPEAAMEDGAPLIHEDFANNIAVGGVFAGTDVDPETMEHDDAKIDAAFAEAEVVVSQRMRNHRLIPNAIETRGCVAHYEGAKGQLTFWSGTQNPHLERIFISGAVGLGEHQVRVIAPEVGGGFGSKINIYGEAFIACILSKQLDAPIKWVADRSEDYLSTTHGRDLIAYVDIAANRAGKVLGLKFRLIQDIGGYEMILSALIPMLTNFMLSGTYDIPAIRSELTEVFTNKTSIDAYRGAGRPEGIYFVERAMDMLAVELDMDPAELRRRNFFKAADFPVTTQMGMVYDSGDYEALLDIALQNAGWEDLKRERDAARAEGRVVGLGLSSYVEICGLAPSAVLPTVGGWEYGSVSVERTGAITVTTGSSSHGQGHETTFAQMVSDQFGGIPLERIRVLHGDTGVVKAGIGTFGSRSQAVGGTALIKAGEKVKAKMARFAAHMMEAKEEDLVFADGKIFVKDVPESSLSFEEVAAYAYIPITLPRDTEPGLSDEAFWEPEGMTFPYGCYICMVEIDRDTGELSLLRWVGVDDCGNIINPLIVDGQIHGGIAQGIGQALTEEAVYDENGQPLTGSLMDYAIPRASDFPRFELSSTVTPTPLNPLGAKGVGEAGTIGSTPAIVNATVDALRPFGVKHVDMMLRPEKLWRLMQDTPTQGSDR